jgi:hypothetical protein
MSAKIEYCQKKIGVQITLFSMIGLLIGSISSVLIMVLSLICFIPLVVGLVFMFIDYPKFIIEETTNHLPRASTPPTPLLFLEKREYKISKYDKPLTKITRTSESSFQK